MSESTELRIAIDDLPEATRKHILELTAQRNISPNEAVLLVLNYTAERDNKAA